MVSNLKVDKIQSVAGTTTAMTFDSSGHVLTPQRPSFFAHRRDQGNQSLSATTFTLVQFNQIDHNIGGHFDTSTYKFTCPVSGVYHFSMHIYIYFTDTAEARFYVNDGQKVRFANGAFASNVNPNGAGGSATMQLNANDTVSVYAYATDASSVYAGSSNESASMFSGFLVG